MLRTSISRRILRLTVIGTGLAAGTPAILPQADAQSVLAPVLPQLVLPQPVLPQPVLPQPPMPVVITPSRSGDIATARRDRNGSFMFDAKVNGTPLQMMFDTGASVTSLRAEDAARIGIDTSELNYSAIVSTANGRTAAAPIIIETLTIGDITRHQIPALVGRPGALGTNLLGQSFMARIGGYRVIGQDLVLQGEP